MHYATDSVALWKFNRAFPNKGASSACINPGFKFILHIILSAAPKMHL